ncbi:tyrosine-type recombinase/integrase [Enterobacter cloacae]|uniref:tyrosine-type recombinase/integrase n=1 Tax=Enterobacter cloacae TaxID=550 RepID=UPI003A0FD8C1
MRRCCGEVLRYAVATGRAKYNFAPDLAIALSKPKTQHFPFLTESELPTFIKALENNDKRLVTKYATQLLMLTGVRNIELRAVGWKEFDLYIALWEIPQERIKKTPRAPGPIIHSSDRHSEKTQSNYKQL